MGRTIVVAGGTDGMGRAIAVERAAAGDTVVVIGSTEEKARTLPEGVRFLKADLASIAEVDRVVAELSDVDVLVLMANRLHAKRTVTADGLEATFALYYLSRFLLAHGVKPGLVIAFSAPGVTAGKVHWDDPQLAHGYSSVKAQMQAGRLNDLLGVAFAEETGIPYVLYHPGFTKTNAISQMPQPMRTVVRVLEKVAARPVADAIRPVLRLIDAPPDGGFHPIDRDKPVDAGLKTFDPADAARLADLTREVVRRRR